MQRPRGFLVAEAEGADGVADVGSRESRLAVHVNREVGEASLALAEPRLGGELEDEVELGRAAEYNGNVRTRNSCTSHACKKNEQGNARGREK
jgi:hypothetical protein